MADKGKNGAQIKSMDEKAQPWYRGWQKSEKTSGNNGKRTSCPLLTITLLVIKNKISKYACEKNQSCYKPVIFRIKVKI